VRKLNKKTLIVTAVAFVAVCSTLATVLVYFMNTERRQRILLDSAQRHLSEDDHTRAALQYRRALQLGEASGDVYFKYGQCLEKLKQPRKAFQAYARAANLDANHVDAYKRIVGVYYQQARIALAKSGVDVEKVAPLKHLKKCADTLIRLEPTGSNGYIWLARVQSLRGKDAQAMTTLRRARPLCGNDAKLTVEGARQLIQSGKLNDADAYVREGLVAQPKSPELLLALASVHRRRNKPAEEEEALTKVLHIQPENVAALGQRGLLYWRQERFDMAQADLKALCRLAPKDGVAWISLSGAYTAAKQPDKALSTLAKACSLNPDQYRLIVELVRLQIDSRQLDEARQKIEALAKTKCPPQVVGWLRGQLALKADKIASAKNYFHECIRKSKNGYPAASLGLGACYVREGNLGAAEAQFRLAARSSKLYRRAMLAIVDIFLVEGLHEKALAQCAEIRRLTQPKVEGESAKADPALQMLAGRAQFGLGRLDDATKNYKLALEHLSDEARKAQAFIMLTRVALARYTLAVGSKDKALAEASLRDAAACFEEARKLDGNSTTVKFMAARLASARGEKSKARKIIIEACTSASATESFIRQQVRQRIIVGNSGQMSLVEDMVAMHPESSGVLNAAAEYFGTVAMLSEAIMVRSKGKAREKEAERLAQYRGTALKHARKAFQLDAESVPNAERLYDLLLSNDHEAEAEAMIARLINSPLMKPTGLALQGLLYQRRGHGEKAAKCLRESISLNGNNWHTHLWLGRVYAATDSNLANAEASLTRALELRPTAKEARRLLFKVFQAQGKFARIQAEIAEILKSQPRNVELLRISAAVYKRTGDMKNAALRLKAVAKAMPGDVRAHIEYSQAERSLGHDGEAIASAKRALAIRGNSVPALRALLWAYLAANDRAAAESHLRKALEQRPDDAALSMFASEFYGVLGQSEKAEARLKKLADAQPDDAFIQFRLAEFYLRAGRFKEAMAKYQAALQVNPKFMAAEFGVSVALIRQANTTADTKEKGKLLNRARAGISALKKRYPKDIRPGLAEARMLAAEKNYDQALVNLKALASKHDEAPAVMLYMADLYMILGRMSEAEATLKAALAKDERLVDFQLKLARLNLERNRLKEALRNCKDALVYEPVNRSALQLAAQIQQRLGKGADSLPYLERVVALQPSDVAPLVRLVQTLLGMKRTQHALVATRQAYSRNATSSRFLAEYVRVLLLSKKTLEAEITCKSFIAAHPDSEVAKLLLAQACYRTGKLTEANSALRIAEEKAKDKDRFLARAVVFCTQAGWTERAAQLAQRLAAKRPKDPSAHAAWLRILWKMNKADDALKVALDGMARNPDSADFLMQGVQALVRAKRTDKAMDACKRFTARNPKQISVLMVLIELQANSGVKKDALANLKKVAALNSQSSSPQVAKGLIRFYLKLEQQDLAEKEAMRLCRAAPRNAGLWLAYGTVCERLEDKRRSRVIQIYREALSQPLQGQRAKMLLINNLTYALVTRQHESAAEKQRNLAEAETLIEPALGDWETAPTPLLDTAGWLRFHQGKHDGAYRLLALAANRHDAGPETLYHFAMACGRTGRAEEARAAVKKASKAMSGEQRWVKDVEKEIAESNEGL
jgi:tetratricopeptide (TPR) repeat protein